jgi:hypothetical protein
MCLATVSNSTSGGTLVVLAACDNTKVTQYWARGSAFESFNLTGLSHIGMYPDFIQDLRNIGVTDQDLVPLFQSAEAYLQMWERARWSGPK